MQTHTSFEYSESNLQIYMYVSACTLTSYLQCMTQFVAVQCNVYNEELNVQVCVYMSLMMHYHTVQTMLTMKTAIGVAICIRTTNCVRKQKSNA